MKAIKYILCALAYAYLAWVLVSLIEVACLNLDPNHAYSTWNFFVLVFS